MYYQSRLQFTRTRLQECVRLVLRQIRQHAHDAIRSGSQLAVGRAQIHHQVAVGLTEQDHRPGAQHVEDHLGCRTGLEACGAAEHLGADYRRDVQLSQGREIGVRIAGQANREDAELSCIRQCIQHIGRTAAGGDADEHIPCR